MRAELDRIPLFALASEATRERLAAVATTMSVRSGGVILRRGDPGRALYAVLGGGVAATVDSSDLDRKVFMGPGEVFGEMSLLSRLPVSAAVVAQQDSTVLALPKGDVLAALDMDTDLRAGLTQVLVGRAREGDTDAEGSGCVLIGAPASQGGRRIAAAIARGISHYEPGSRVLLADEVGGAHGLAAEIASWRGGSESQGYLVGILDAGALQSLAQDLGRGDVVVSLDDGVQDDDASTVWIGRFGLAVVARVRCGADAPLAPSERWSHRLGEQEVEGALEAQAWVAADVPTLDRLVRWIVRREIGVALGAGAARGFAHLGVLAVLEEAGVPIDCLTGSSMGGIVALLLGLGGSARAAEELARRVIGSNAMIRDVRWLPRSSFLAGRKVRRNAESLAAGRSFADLDRPVAVVAADLARGERVVLDRGPLSVGMLATAAIPGALPPIVDGARVLVDGALVSRIPIDVLDRRRRCGLRIAVNVMPSPDTEADERENIDALRQRIDRPFGFREVIGRSWELLGWWHGAMDARTADILIEPRTRRWSGYDFGTLDEMVAAGRRAAEDQIDEIARAANAALTPRGALLGSP